MSESNTVPASIQIADIANAVQCIDYACESGAYKGWKLIKQVESVRERLVLFLNSVQVQQDAANPTSTEETNESSVLSAG